VRLFFDRNLSPHLAAAVGNILTNRNVATEHARNRWATDPGDATILATLAAEEGWVILTMDQWHKKAPAERKAWHEAGITTFFLTGQWNTESFEQAWRLFRWLPDILENARTVRRGTGLRLPLRHSRGHLAKLYSPPTPA
jgi:hypothetical protein